MRKGIGTLSVLLMVVLAAACSQKAPVQNDPQSGIMALPAHASNASRYSKEFPFYYRLISSVDDIKVPVYPHLGMKFVFSDELPAGKYYLDKVEMLHDGAKGLASEKKKLFNLKNSLIIEIEPGKATIPNAIFTVKTVEGGPHSTYTSWNMEYLNEADRKEYIEQFQKLENANFWQISSTP